MLDFLEVKVSDRSDGADRADGPEGTQRGRPVARVRAEWSETIADALLYGRGCRPAGTGGRGSLLRFTYPEGEGIIRRYRRGGLMRHFIAERYLFVNRPRQEFALHCWLYEQGLPIPAPLGVLWERRGPFFGGAIATHALNALNLLDWLREHPGLEEGKMRDCGALFRRMHDLGVWHADLQVANVLAAEEGLYLIDFDKARRMRQVPKLARMRNLLRFRRSLEKRGLPLQHFALLCAGYGGEEPMPWLQRLYTVKGRLSDVARRG